jgi:beta-glucosidase
MDVFFGLKAVDTMTRTATSIIILLMTVTGTMFSQVEPHIPAYPEDEYERIFNDIVLLKNHGSLLPVKDSGINSIALIGPVINHPSLGSHISEKGSSSTLDNISPYQAVRELAGDNIELLTAPGINMHNDIIRLDSTMVYIGQGVNGYSLKYYNNQKVSGSPVAFSTDKFIDHYWTESPHPELDSAFSLSWDATLIPTHGPVKVKLIHSDGCRMSVDGENIIDNWETGPVRADSAWLNIRKGESYNLRIDFFSDGQGPAMIKFGFDYLESNMMFDALEKAAKADLVMVFVGQTVNFNENGSLQPAYQIPRQSQMIKEIYEVNPNMVVVLQTQAAVNIESWAFNVPAIIQAGSPRLNDSKEIAAVLFGKKNPHGKLSYLWTMNWNQNYATRYPFGHGLSYSTIGIGKLMMRRNRDASGWTATVEVRNMGQRTGTEVLQIYIIRKNGGIMQFTDEMKTFKTVTLLPEQKKIVTIQLPYDVFKTYDPENDQWIIIPGLYEIRVGVSEEDIKLRKTIEIKEQHIKQD